MSDQVESTDRTRRHVDTSRPATARVWDHLLGGKDNFEIDRAVADAMIQACPDLPHAGRESRNFLLRAVRCLASEAGIRQFAEIGTGLPSWPAVHEVAQKVDPAARVVYVDNDQMVLMHARALLTGPTWESTGYIDADVRKTDRLVSELGNALDLTRPVGLLMCGLLHEIAGEEPERIMGELVSALAPGSYVVLSHYTADLLDDEARDQLSKIESLSSLKFEFRSRDEVGQLLAVAGLELVQPGLVSAVQWRPKLEPQGTVGAERDAMCYAVVARKV